MTIIFALIVLLVTLFVNIITNLYDSYSPYSPVAFTIMIQRDLRVETDIHGPGGSQKSPETLYGGQSGLRS